MWRCIGKLVLNSFIFKIVFTTTTTTFSRPVNFHLQQKKSFFFGLRPIFTTTFKRGQKNITVVCNNRAFSHNFNEYLLYFENIVDKASVLSHYNVIEIDRK